MLGLNKLKVTSRLYSGYFFIITEEFRLGVGFMNFIIGKSSQFNIFIFINYNFDFYSPFISDIHSFKHLEIKFQKSKPFLPFEQLLSVLPAASKKLLPVAYHELMTDRASKILQYYPTNFETDLNGKKQEWEAVVLIPFIDERLLLQEMRTKENLLSKAEIERNIHGPMFEYFYHPIAQGSCDGN